MAKKREDEPTFRQARERLDEILDELEREAGDVDQLAARVREASELIRFCRERLAAARQEVTEVVASLAPEADDDAAEDGADDDDRDDDASDDDDDDEDDEDDEGGGRRGGRGGAGKRRADLPF